MRKLLVAGPAHQGKHCALIDRSGWMQKRGGMFSLMCGTSGDEGRFVNFTLKRGGVAFKDERGSAERHRYFNDSEKLLKKKILEFLYQ